MGDIFFSTRKLIFFLDLRTQNKNSLVEILQYAPKSAGMFFGRHFSLFDPILCFGQTERRRGVVANLRGGGDPSPEANFFIAGESQCVFVVSRSVGDEEGGILTV